MNDESTPKGAHEIPAKGSTPIVAAGTDFTAEDRHAAFVAGYEIGKAERIEAEIEGQVLARLHRHALVALKMAKRYAEPKGPAWAAMFGEPE